MVELIAVLVILGVLILMLLPGLLTLLTRGRHGHPRASCQNNLKQWGLVHRMYAGESRDGLFPPMSALAYGGDAAVAFPDMQSIYPDYMSDPSISICPDSSKLMPVLSERHDRLPFEVLAQIRSLMESGQATQDCHLVHLTSARSYVYFNYETQTPTQAQVAWEAWQQAGELALAMVRDSGNPDYIRLPVGLEPAQFGHKVDLGAGCPYTQETWYLNGRFLAGSEAPWITSGAVDSPYTTKSGDVLTAWRGDEAPGGEGWDADRAQRVPEAIPLASDLPRPGGADEAMARVQRMSKVPVMWDTFVPEVAADGTAVTNHDPAGSNVLFMDGHVEWVRWRPPHGDRFPLKRTPPEVDGDGKDWLQRMAPGE